MDDIHNTFEYYPAIILPKRKTCASIPGITDGCKRTAVTSGHGRILGLCSICAIIYYKDYHRKYYQGLAGIKLEDDESKDPPEFFHVSPNAKTISECRNPDKIVKMIDELLNQ